MTCISSLIFFIIILFSEVFFDICFKVLSLHHLEILFQYFFFLILFYFIFFSPLMYNHTRSSQLYYKYL